MILAIDTSSDKNGIALYWSEAKKQSSAKGRSLYFPNKLEKEIFWVRQKASEELLPNIEKLLKKNEVSLKDLKAIAVFEGPGSYTGLRVGISVANTLGFALKIPVIGFKGTRYQTKPLKIAKEAFSKIKKAKIGDLATPFYPPLR